MGFAYVWPYVWPLKQGTKKLADCKGDLPKGAGQPFEVEVEKKYANGPIEADKHYYVRVKANEEPGRKCLCKKVEVDGQGKIHKIKFETAE